MWESGVALQTAVEDFGMVQFPWGVSPVPMLDRTE
jgi:hypothetical protein